MEILPKFGYLTFTSFVITALSGVLLGTIYDSSNAQLSISLMLMQNPAGALIRSLHYWSAQLFLILAIIHVIEHLLKFKDISLSEGVWLRTVLSVPVIIYVMLSGFFLRGDSESNQAILIFSEIIKSVPLIGDSISFLLLGLGNNLQIVYLHHVATATILIWLSASEHSRVFFSDRKSYLWILPAVFLLGLFLIPSIHLKEISIIKSPWYFLGLQEFLHLINYPLAAIIILLLLLSILYFYPKFKSKSHRLISLFLISGSILYIVLTIIGAFFRGEQWNFEYSSNNIASQFNYHNIFDYSGQPDSLYNKKLFIVDGRAEGCLSCHSGTKGLSQYHNPDSIGCYKCHLGNPLTLNKKLAHEGIILTPGNLAYSGKTCGTVDCHIGITDRVNLGLMNTMSGVITVDKYIFGEIHDLNKHSNVHELGNSPADSHLRGLCAGCHLGNNKTLPDTISELSRGGGCTACHLQYHTDAAKELSIWKKYRNTNIKYHPDINIKVSQNSCFGCHSRSGRISTNYEGWHETLLSIDEFNKIKDKSNYRILQDDRIFIKVKSDVHFDKGLICIDCHTSYELMGNGINYKHKEDAVQIECTDCHRMNKAKTIEFPLMDTESQKIIRLRNLFANGRQFVLLSESGLPLINVYIDKINNPIMRLKNKDTLLILKSPVKQCAKDIPGHSRLNCKTCHSNWAPQCLSCHTSFDKNVTGWDNLKNKETNGAWIETGNLFLSEPPTLGVVTKKLNGTNIDEVSTFVPGMIMTLKKKNSAESAFNRFFAPSSPHTIIRESRDCRSCHNNPVALGYGRGRLEYKINKRIGKWIFSPAYPLSKIDGLPSDAWIGFLSYRNNSTTRLNTRPFSVDEQKKILVVGACLTCHKDSDRKLVYVFQNFVNYKKLISTKCVVPEY